MDESPDPPALRAELARLRAGITTVADRLEYGSHSTPYYAAAELRALIGAPSRCRVRWRARWRAGILVALDDQRIDGGRCTLDADHKGDHKPEELP